MKIKEILSYGELYASDEPIRNSEDLLDQVGEHIVANYLQDNLGSVHFLGEDGKKYRVVITATIEEIEEEDDLTPAEVVILKNIVGLLR